MLKRECYFSFQNDGTVSIHFHSFLNSKAVYIMYNEVHIKMKKLDFWFGVFLLFNLFLVCISVALILKSPIVF